MMTPSAISDRVLRRWRRAWGPSAIFGGPSSGKLGVVHLRAIFVGYSSRGGALDNLCSGFVRAIFVCVWSAQRA